MSALETIQGLLSAGSEPPLHQGQVHLRPSPVTSTAPVPTPTATSTPTTKKSTAKITRQQPDVLLIVATLILTWLQVY
jgi:hypothetical protein